MLLFFVVAAVLAFLLNKGNAAAEVLWQSPPQSPIPEEETQAEPPTATPLPPTATPLPPTPVPTEPPAGEASTQLTEPTSTPVEPTPTPSIEPTPTLVEPTPSQTNQSQAQGRRPEPLDLQEEIPFESEEEGRQFILDRIELIDTLAVYGAYIWLCCGVGLLLTLPIFLLILYIRGRSHILQDENYY